MPSRGDWTELPAQLEEPVLPELPAGDWPERTRRLWEAWRQDPVTATFGETEVAMAIDLAHVHKAGLEMDKVGLLTEFRLRADALGLTPKGRRDLRLRVGADPHPEAKQSRSDDEVAKRRDARRARLTGVN